ncbi:hypothetical protein [Phormidesmis sp. 146-33]
MSKITELGEPLDQAFLSIPSRPKSYRNFRTIMGDKSESYPSPIYRGEC